MLTVTETDPDPASSDTTLDIEMSIGGDPNNGRDRKPYKFRSHGQGPIRIGSELADAELTVPHRHVRFGPCNKVTLITPVAIECALIQIRAKRLVVEPAAKEDFAISAFLKADAAESSVAEPPVLRAHTSMAVAWPGARAYLWTQVAVEILPVADVHVEEGLRGLRRFVTAFRAGGRGQLGRTKDKIESKRMVKDAGEAVLAALKRDNILRLEGRLYLLDPQLLGEKVGVNYIQCQTSHFPPRAIDFVSRALRADE